MILGAVASPVSHWLHPLISREDFLETAAEQTTKWSGSGNCDPHKSNGHNYIHPPFEYKYWVSSLPPFFIESSLITDTTTTAGYWK